MSEIIVSGNTYNEALDLGLKQLGVPQDAVDIEEMSQAHDDTLPGAEPLPGTTLRLRVKSEILVRRAKDHLKRILDIMGVQAHVELLNRKRGPTLNVMAGDDGALIIGKNGQTLDALQYLVNRMAAPGGREFSLVIVDSEGYKEKRISRIEELAHKTAQRVLRQQREVELEPMSPSDRKIVHITLKEVRGIHTISRGEEGERRVVITPAKGEAPNRDRGRAGR